ncbi:MAG: SdrD B-like domain-containing protein [Armatimonadia bacterium]
MSTRISLSLAAVSALLLLATPAMVFAASGGSSAYICGYVFLDGSADFPADTPNGMWDEGETGFAGINLGVRLYYRKTSDGPMLQADLRTLGLKGKTQANGFYSIPVTPLDRLSATLFPVPEYYEVYLWADPKNASDPALQLIGSSSPYNCTTDPADAIGMVYSKHGEDASRTRYGNIQVPVPATTNPVFNWYPYMFPRYRGFMTQAGAPWPEPPLDWSSDELSEYARKHTSTSGSLSAPNVRQHIDFGFYAPKPPSPAEVGDYVWEDANLNGIQDADEAPIPGVTVHLYALKAAGWQEAKSPQVTDTRGFYLFRGLPGGYYKVQFDKPTGWIMTTQNQGSDDTVDSDADPTDGYTEQFTLNSGESDRTWDAGMYRLASIGDFVWEDLNGNGLQDSGEPGVAGVAVELFTADGKSAGTCLTDADGKYLFTGLTPGTYYVQFTLPSGYRFTTQDAGSDDALDSDAGPDGSCAKTFLQSGETDLTWDAGVYRLAAIGDRAWLDSNVNGLQDDGEPGLAGVTVKLFDAQGAEVATQQTDASGLYLFTNLAPDSYHVEFMVPDGYNVTLQDAGDDALDSDIDAQGVCAPTTLESNETDRTWDAGLYADRYEIAKSGGKVWGNCRTIGFWKNNIGKAIAGTTRGTQVSRSNLVSLLRYVYSFYRDDPYKIQFGAAPTDNELLARAYEVLSNYDASDMVQKTRCQLLGCELNYASTQVAGFPDYFALIDAAAQGSFCAQVEDALNTPGIDLAPYHELCDWINNQENYVHTDTTGIGDYVAYTIVVKAQVTQERQVEVRDYLDSALAFVSASNGGTFSATDRCVSWNVTVSPAKPSVTLTLWTRVVASPAGDAGTPGDGWTASNVVSSTCSGASWVSGRERCPVVVSTLSNQAWLRSTSEQPLVTSAKVGDRVWEDANGNGVQDAGEAGVAGVQVTLHSVSDASVADATTTTDAGGCYQFAVAKAGTYQLLFSVPTGYTVTTAHAGGNDAADSDIDATGNTAEFPVAAGASDVTWDAGLCVQRNETVNVSLTKSGVKVYGSCMPALNWYKAIDRALVFSSGATISKQDLLTWLGAVNSFYLTGTGLPFELGSGATMLSNAATILAGASSSDPVAQARAQLLACELNLLSGTYAASDQATQRRLCEAMEDALANSEATNLAVLTQVLAQVNALGSGSQDPQLGLGDAVVFTITVNATLSQAKTIQVADYLDSSLQYYFSDSGAGFSTAENRLDWSLSLPAGDSRTELRVIGFLQSTPSAGQLSPGADWAASNQVSLPYASGSALTNTAWWRAL